MSVRHADQDTYDKWERVFVSLPVRRYHKGMAMNVSDIIASIINALLSRLFSNQSMRADDNSGKKENTDPKSPVPVDGDKGDKEPIPGGSHMVTIPERVTANFYSTGSPAWKNQPGGMHHGTDFSAPAGAKVYAPYSFTVARVGWYGDDGRYGFYVIGHMVGGEEYYSGHLKDVTVNAGEQVPAGAVIGYTNHLNHTHVQLRVNGKLTDFEEWRRKN